MKYVVCAVYDIVADTFMPAFCQNNVGGAIRQFSDEINRVAEDNILYKHPRDFDFYQLGFFESDSGELIADKKRLLRGADTINMVGVEQGRNPTN